MGDQEMHCSRVWLLRILEIGETYYTFDGIKKRSLFVRANNTMKNSITNISLIISTEGDCLLYLNGRTLHGRVEKTCTSNPRDGSQYVLRVDGHVYKLSILEDYKTAIFEEALNIV
jgi:hypothetical protein